MGHWEYWDYVRLPPKPVKDGIKAKTQRGAIGSTWWSKRWIGILESFGLGARLGRGRSYARKGQVVSLDIEKGIIRAKVQGTRPHPYAISIALNPLSENDWDKVTDAMAAQAVFAARLLSGEMPQNIENAFGEAKIPLFPTSAKELVTNCSCPDWANPCKHIAAVYYIIAERFDDDPFLIFKLRGRTREEIIKALREKRGAALSSEEGTLAVALDSGKESGVAPLDGCLGTFWEAGEALDSFTVEPGRPEVDNAVLKRLGNAPFSIGKTNIAAILAGAYTAAGRAALRKAAGEDVSP